VEPHDLATSRRTFALRARKLLIVTFLLLSGVTLYIRADINPARGAQPPKAGSVTVTDSAITPTSVTILAGGSVLWTNQGSRPHRIVSSRGAFDAFWLASAHSHRVPFPLPGVYPYTVDAVTKGLVVVITGSAGVTPSTGANASTTISENCGNPKIYHYDIEVTVHRDEAYTFTPWHTPGTVTRVFDWQANWLRAPMSVELCRGQVRVLLPAGASSTSNAEKEGLAAGESTVKIAWDDKSELIDGLPQDPSSLVPLCHFTDISGSPAKTALDGYRLPNGNNAQFEFRAIRINPQAYHDMINKSCDHRRATSGPTVPPPDLVSSTFAPFHTIDGLGWTLSEDGLTLSVSSHRPPMPFPLDALALGKGFDFRTGPLRTEIRTTATSDAVSDSATVSFTPVRP